MCVVAVVLSQLGLYWSDIRSLFSFLLVFLLVFHVCLVLLLLVHRLDHEVVVGVHAGIGGNLHRLQRVMGRDILSSVCW